MKIKPKISIGMFDGEYIKITWTCLNNKYNGFFLASHFNKVLFENTLDQLGIYYVRCGYFGELKCSNKQVDFVVKLIKECYPFKPLPKYPTWYKKKPEWEVEEYHIIDNNGYKLLCKRIKTIY